MSLAAEIINSDDHGFQKHFKFDLMHHEQSVFSQNESPGE